jgi:hypothetical protein
MVYLFHYMRNLIQSRILRGVLTFSIVPVFFPLAAFASFVPGQTLDPLCAPSDPTCVVIGVATNVAGSFTATSTNATSTFAGGFSVANGGLVFDRSTRNVGIGTQNPSAVLDVQSSGGSLLGLTSSTTFAGIQMFSYRNSALTHSLIEGLGARGTKTSPLAVQGGDALLSLRAGGYGTTDFDSNMKDDAAAIEFKAESTFSDTGSTPTHPGMIVFETASGNQFDLEKMRLTSGGNLGIGTTSPSQKLEVGGNINISSGSAYMYNGLNVVTASTPQNNYFFGDAGNLTMSGFNNTAAGYTAFASGTSGSYNAAFGVRALSANTGGTSNTATGNGSLAANTVGSGDTAGGVDTLAFNVTGNYNTAHGWSSLHNTGQAVTAGSFVIGASYTIQTTGSTDFTQIGAANSSVGTVFTATGIGTGTGTAASNANYNTAYGATSGYGLTTGSNNVLIGPSIIATSYNQVTSGSRNISIGSDVAIASSTLSNQLVIGNIIYGTGLTGTGTTIAGSIGIGTSSPTAQLHTTGTVRFSNFGAGTLTTDASGNLSVSSDERLKNIDGQFTRSLSDILKINPISYHWNQLSGLDTSNSYTGFSAQNMQAAIPEAVGSSTNGFLSLQDRPILATIVNAVKDIGNITGVFKDNLVAWLGDANNALPLIHAIKVQGDTVQAGKLCVGTTCVTEAQFMQMVAASSQSGGSAGIGASNSDNATSSENLTVPATSTQSGDESTTTP